MEKVNKLPKNASFVRSKRNNPNANNFIYFPYPEVLEYYTVTGDNATKPNSIFKETFLLDEQEEINKVLLNV